MSILDLIEETRRTRDEWLKSILHERDAHGERRRLLAPSRPKLHDESS